MDDEPRVLESIRRSLRGVDEAWTMSFAHSVDQALIDLDTIRFENSMYQMLAPEWHGERGGQVIVEQRPYGSMTARFKRRYL